jgi:glucose/arabinose dehydrogenase
MVHGGLDFPVAFRFAPDGRLFYLELTTGRVQVFDSPFGNQETTWADFNVDADGERGLLGMAFHPQYPDSPYVYFYYTHKNPLENRVVRMREVNGAGTGEQILFRLPATDLHNGGRLAFGPDGMLYVTYGDQEVASAARVLTDVRGKIHRLTPLGQPAPHNFSYGNPAFVRGVREVFGICFDPAVPGRGYFTENGPECDDEINALWSGADYGWGTNDPCGGDVPGVTKPLVRMSPTVAPTGCCVYRGGPDPGLDGSLFFGTFNEGDVRRVEFDPLTGAVASVSQVIPSGDAVLDVVQGPDGMIWYSTFDAIYRITYQALDAPLPSLTPRLRAWPNPSSRDVSFRLAVPGECVALEVIDTGGRRIRELTVTDGFARWDGRDTRGVMAPAGVYLVRLREGNAVHSLRVVRLAH